MKNLILPNEVSILSRPISDKIEPNRVEAYISEAQQVKVKKALGSALLIDLCDNETTEANKLILEGGEYEVNNVRFVVRGLKVTLAYYTYAKLVVNNPVNITRFGAKTVNSENSQSIDWKQLTAIASDAESYGDDCLTEVLDLLNAKPQDYPLFKTSESKPIRGKSSIFSIGQ